MILFIDDLAVASQHGLQRVPTPAVKHPDNPILYPTMPWEMGAVYIFGSVIKEPENGLFRMWYQAIDDAEATAPGHMTICYIT